MGASASSKVLPSPGRPISAVEFADSLFSTWRHRGPHQGRRTKVFGLAISGGADSMALATLCSRIKQTPFKTIVSEIHPNHVATATVVLPGLSFQAFIVDHGVREGSSIEAIAVSRVLEQYGIHAQVLKIDWGKYERPGDLPNFESLARRYRFQTLGRACRDRGIDSLFLAHHEDDQAETVMMRMINGHRRFGLVGMKRDSEIPECHGIHGVHESGGLNNTLNQTITNSSASLTQDLQSKVGYLKPLPTEIGGIRVYRPLLGFKKARLMATCKAANIEWFEDNSNKDPTVTTRNAIRHMYNSHSVPTALTAPSLLNLSEKIERNYNNLLKVANSCLEGTTKNLETRTGTMSICFPYLGHLNSSVSRGDKGLVAALILRQVITFVTPEEQVHLHALHGAVDRIFPEIFKDVSLPKPTAFTVSGVQFRPLRASTVHIEAQSLEGKYEWLISRQPYSSILSNRPNIRAPPPSNSFLQPPWSPWTLYDGRFWFRIQNRSARSIVIRPFMKDDMATFMLSLDKSHQTLLRDVLKNLAPGDVRWTLPAIVTEELDGRERVLALPTLDVCALNMQKHVSWEVRYKKVDTGRLQYR